jgi:hypothetical protein
MGMRRSPVTLARVLRRRLVVGGVVLVALWFIAFGPPLERPLNEPCPSGPRGEEPIGVQLSVTILEHESWVQVPAAEVSQGMLLVACADGKAIGRRKVEERDILNDAVRIGVPTRWVLGQWLSGDLDPYRSTGRWRVVFPASAGGAEVLGRQQARQLT